MNNFLFCKDENTVSSGKHKSQGLFFKLKGPFTVDILHYYNTSSPAAVTYKE